MLICMYAHMHVFVFVHTYSYLHALFAYVVVGNQLSVCVEYTRLIFNVVLFV